MSIIKEIAELVPEKVVKTLIVGFSFTVLLALLEIIFTLGLLSSVLPKYLTSIEAGLVIAIYLIKVLAQIIQTAAKIWEASIKAERN